MHSCLAIALIVVSATVILDSSFQKSASDAYCIGSNSQPEEEREMATATWNGTVIAESEKTVVVEGNHYFPPESVNTQYLKPSATTSRCPWKGLANYCSLIVDGKINEDAAWYYAKPSDAAAAIKGYIAFWKGVDVR